MYGHVITKFSGMGTKLWGFAHARASRARGAPLQIFPSQGKYVCGLFDERSVRIYGGKDQKSNMSRFFEFSELFLLPLLFRPRNCHRTSFTVGRRKRKLEFHDSWSHF